MPFFQGPNHSRSVIGSDKMKRLYLLVLIIVMICKTNSSFVEHPTECNSARKKPNIIVIIADDLGWNDVSFHGADQIPTPNIDALAMHGIILNRHYAQPTCSPSRTAFLTGRYPIRSGMQGYLPLKPGQVRGIPLETTLLPEYLRNLGYTTRLVGKWHVGYHTRDYTPARRGFDSFFGYYSGYIKYFEHTLTSDNQVGYDIHRDTPTHSEVKYTRQYFTDLVTAKVENIIAQHDGAKPLFLQVAHLAPHSGEPDDPMEVPDMRRVNATFGYIRDIKRRKYAGMVASLDQSVGRTVMALKNAGMLEDSIILFMADNGAQTEGLHENYGSNYPLRGLKFTLFDGGIRTAACIYSPLIRDTSRVSSELVHITDWLPTLYSAAGGNVSDLGVLDGFDQWSSLVTGKKSPRDSALLNIEEVEEVEGAMMGNHKLIRGFQREYTDFYGDSGRGSPNPEYNTTAVQYSLVGRAIGSVIGRNLSAEHIEALRNDAQISCAAFESYKNCTDVCLFDMVADPCETTDISADNPEVVRMLETYITSFYDVLVPQPNTTVDPASYPCNFNGVWQPWLPSTSGWSQNEIPS